MQVKRRGAWLVDIILVQTCRPTLVQCVGVACNFTRSRESTVWWRGDGDAAAARESISTSNSDSGIICYR